MKKKEYSVAKKQAASRLRLVRENAGLTQEQFAEILDITVSAYKKVESGENQISTAVLRKLYDVMNVSTDYILYGDTKNPDGVWTTVLNCSEVDKMYLLIRLLSYFTKIKPGTFPLKGESPKKEEEICQLLERLRTDEDNM